MVFVRGGFVGVGSVDVEMDVSELGAAVDSLEPEVADWFALVDAGTLTINARCGKVSRWDKTKHAVGLCLRTTDPVEIPPHLVLSHVYLILVAEYVEEYAIMVIGDEVGYCLVVCGSG